MSSKIKTLVQLEQEKMKLKMEIEVSKRAFIHSFGTTQTQAKDFIVKKVAIPVGAIGLATIGANQFLSNASAPTKNHISKNSNLFQKIIPIVLPFIQSFLAEPERLKMFPAFVRDIIAPKVAVKKAKLMEKV